MFRLLRFPGWRRVAALMIGFLLTWIASGFFAWRPPADWESWPQNARLAVCAWAAFAYKWAFCAWVSLLLSPLFERRDKTGLLASATALLVALWWGVSGFWDLLYGGFCLLNDDAYAKRVSRAVLWVAYAPMVIGALPLIIVEAIERLEVNPFLRRWLLGGRGHAATWIRKPELTKLCKPIPKGSPPPTGFISDGMFMGLTMFEHGVGRKSVWVNDKAHKVTCAMTGAGKFTTSLGLNTIFHGGSGVYISPKPEIADFAVGRRTDPTIFDRPDAHKLGRKLGVDPRGITCARFHLPNGRSFVLDPTGQSVYPSCYYNPLCEVDIRKSNARVMLLAIATGSFPDKDPGSGTDAWFVDCPRGFLAAGAAHVMTTDGNPAHHNLPFVIDRLMGIDPQTGIASPKTFGTTLKAMLRNHSLDGFVQAAASNVSLLGEKAFGNLYSELETNCRWMTDGPMRRHLSQGSDFKFNWLGKDHPISVFIIPPRGDAALQAAIPWLRTIAELSLQIFQTMDHVPQTPLWWIADEYAQWGAKVSGVKKGLQVLRDRNIMCHLYLQSWAQAINILGENGAAELESASTVQLFGVQDLTTAKHFSERLGKLTLRERDKRGVRSWHEVDLVTPAELMLELRLTSHLQYVFPPGVLPMRLERAAFKDLRTIDGGRFEGLPLEGHYDDGLTKQSFAARSA